MPDSHINVISSNAISIAMSIIPIFPVAVVDTFADGDVWTTEAVETSDMVKTTDGKPAVWAKNAIITGTLNLLATSNIAKILDMAVLSQSRKGNVVIEPYLITMVVRNILSGGFDTYLSGTITSATVGMQVTQDRLGNKAYGLKFAEMLPSVI